MFKAGSDQYNIRSTRKLIGLKKRLLNSIILSNKNLKRKKSSNYRQNFVSIEIQVMLQLMV